MSAPWGAIVQAIDHAMGRMQESAGAGIKVANSQHGGAAPFSNVDSGAGKAVQQDLRNQQDTTSEQEEAAEKAKIGSNATTTGTDASGGGQAEGGAGALGNVGAGGADALGSAGGGESAGGEGAADAASGILSDEDAKVSKLASVKQYAANVGKGFANAGAVATGNKSSVDWKDIDTSAARKAAEDTVKGWREKRQAGNTGDK